MLQHHHLGVYALITSPNARRILLIHKARGPYTGLWDLPGGSPAFGETPPETLTRELLEETGLPASGHCLRTVIAFVHEYTDSTGRAAALHHTAILYGVTADESAPIKSTPDGEDSYGAQWFSLSALPPLSPLAQKAIDTLSEIPW